MGNTINKWLPGAGLILVIGVLVACDPIDPPEKQQAGQNMDQPGQTQQPGQAPPPGG